MVEGERTGVNGERIMIKDQRSRSDKDLGDTPYCNLDPKEGRKSGKVAVGVGCFSKAKQAVLVARCSSLVSRRTMVIGISITDYQMET